MNTHKHARLTYARRLEMVRQLTFEGLSFARAAAEHVDRRRRLPFLAPSQLMQRATTDAQALREIELAKLRQTESDDRQIDRILARQEQAVFVGGLDNAVA